MIFVVDFFRHLSSLFFIIIIFSLRVQLSNFGKLPFYRVLFVYKIMFTLGNNLDPKHVDLTFLSISTCPYYSLFGYIYTITRDHYFIEKYSVSHLLLLLLKLLLATTYTQHTKHEESKQTDLFSKLCVLFHSSQINYSTRSW